MELRRQSLLPFAAAEGAAAERRALAQLAVRRAGGDLHLWTFVKLVMDEHERGRPLRVSHRCLADLLWCSPSKARSTVSRAVAARLVAVAPTWADGQAGNEYTPADGLWPERESARPRMAADSVTDVDARPAADGGERRCALDDGSARPRMAAGSSRTPALTEHPPALTEHPPALREHPPALTEQGSRAPLLRARPRVPDVFNTFPVPVPEPVPEPEPERKERAEEAIAAMLCQSPILAAAQRRIAPRPSERLAHGVWRPLRAEHLTAQATGSLVAWFRAQAAAPRPALPATEAHLLIALAAAVRADTMPAHEVRSSRVAVFVDGISRRPWRVMPCVPDARRRLDDWLAWCRAHGRAEADIFVP